MLLCVCNVIDIPDGEATGDITLLVLFEVMNQALCGTVVM